VARYRLIVLDGTELLDGVAHFDAKLIAEFAAASIAADVKHAAELANVFAEFKEKMQRNASVKTSSLRRPMKCRCIGKITRRRGRST